MLEHTSFEDSENYKKITKYLPGTNKCTEKKNTVKHYKKFEYISSDFYYDCLLTVDLQVSFTLTIAIPFSAI